MSQRRKHILFISIPAYGHLIPLLELARKIATIHQVTFAVSANKADKVRERELIPIDTFPVISIPDGYFEDAHENPLSGALFNRMLNCTVPAVRKLLAAVPVSGLHTPETDTTGNADALGVKDPVDAVIAENTLAAALMVLTQRKVPFYLFSAAASGSVLYSLLITPDTPATPDFDLEEIPFDEVPQPGVEPPPVMQLMKTLLLSMQEATPVAAGIIGNTVEELEVNTISEIRGHERMRTVPFYSVGPLMPEIKASPVNLMEEDRIKQWLDEREVSSVIYISFGTLAMPKPENIKQITTALLSVKRPFIWSMTVKARVHLPPEMRVSLAAQDFLFLDWAPQKAILQHPATGLFISHCGWNSTMESLASGVPVVAWPMFGDQKMNAFDLVRLGSALLIEGTGMVTEKCVPLEVIRQAIEDTAGIRTSASENRFHKASRMLKVQLQNAVAPGGSSKMALSELLLKLSV